MKKKKAPVYSSKTLFSESFGDLYSDINTKDLRHRFPVMAQFEGDVKENLCVFDISARQVSQQNLLQMCEDGWTVRIPTDAARFYHEGYLEYEGQICPLYIVVPK